METTLVKVMDYNEQQMFMRNAKEIAMNKLLAQLAVSLRDYTKEPTERARQELQVLLTATYARF